MSAVMQALAPIGVGVQSLSPAGVERGGVDLVVMSTHGRRGLAHFFLGSVAEAVLRQVSVPVFLVRAPAGAAAHPTLTAS